MSAAGSPKENIHNLLPDHNKNLFSSHPPYQKDQRNSLTPCYGYGLAKSISIYFLASLKLLKLGNHLSTISDSHSSCTTPPIVAHPGSHGAVFQQAVLFQGNKLLWDTSIADLRLRNNLPETSVS